MQYSIKTVCVVVLVMATAAAAYRLGRYHAGMDNTDSKKTIMMLENYKSGFTKLEDRIENLERANKKFQSTQLMNQRKTDYEKYEDHFYSGR